MVQPLICCFKTEQGFQIVDALKTYFWAGTDTIILKTGVQYP